MKQLVRYIPPVHELQKNALFLHILKKYDINNRVLTELVKELLEEIRKSILEGNWAGPEPGTGQFINQFYTMIEARIDRKFTYRLKRVINGTGTILHTNLGRAKLSEQAIQHVIETARNYSNLEYNLEQGERGSRHSHVEEILKQITGAEAAMVVNNNAAAVFLILRTLAKGQEVIVSRGQLVEIGGSFRISSIMEESEAVLVEVGTTNKTHLSDYEEAITEATSMILKVHTSNFKVIGFTTTVSTDELAKLTSQNERIIFYEDLGSGVLYDYRKHGIGEEPVVKEVLDTGADIVSFSGDKLLGGPQAGIIVGKKHLIEQLKKSQLARAFRVDKMTLAALEGTLMEYLRGDELLLNIPTIRDLLITKEELKGRIELFIEKLLEATEKYETRLEESTSQVGGGTMPDVELPTVVAVLRSKTLSSENLVKRLREFTPAIIVRIHKEEIWIDLRTVTHEEEKFIINALLSV